MMLSFQQVVERLRNLAYQLGAGSPDAARAEISAIDVSDIVIPRCAEAESAGVWTQGVQGQRWERLTILNSSAIKSALPAPIPISAPGSIRLDLNDWAGRYRLAASSPRQWQLSMIQVLKAAIPLSARTGPGIWLSSRLSSPNWR